MTHHIPRGTKNQSIKDNNAALPYHCYFEKSKRKKGNSINFGKMFQSQFEQEHKPTVGAGFI